MVSYRRFASEFILLMKTWKTFMYLLTYHKSSHQRCSVKKVPQACNFIKKETLAQVFSCEFCKISKNTFYTGHLRTTASENTKALYSPFLSRVSYPVVSRHFPRKVPIFSQQGFGLWIANSFLWIIRDRPPSFAFNTKRILAK